MRLAEERGVKAEEILAIGDNWNDVSMLEVAGRAVLMANAPEDLKAVAAERGWRLGRGMMRMAWRWRLRPWWQAAGRVAGGRVTR